MGLGSCGAMTRFVLKQNPSRERNPGPRWRDERARPSGVLSGKPREGDEGAVDATAPGRDEGVGACVLIACTAVTAVLDSVPATLVFVLGCRPLTLRIVLR